MIGLFLILAALLTALILVLRGKETIDKIMIWLAVCAALLIGGPWLLPNTFLRFPEYHLISSEDQRHTILVEEMTALFTAHGNYYEQTGRCVYRYAGEYFLYECYRPFSENTYHVDWREDGATINVTIPDVEEVERTHIVFADAE